MPTLESLSSVGAPGSKRRSELESLVGLIRQQTAGVERPLVERASRERSSGPFPNPDLEFKAPRPVYVRWTRLYPYTLSNLYPSLIILYSRILLELRLVTFGLLFAVSLSILRLMDLNCFRFVLDLLRSIKPHASSCCITDSFRSIRNELYASDTLIK